MALDEQDPTSPAEPDAAGPALPAQISGKRGLRLVRRIRRRLLLAIAVANLVGVAVVIACIWWVLPGGDITDTGTVVAINAIVGGIFLVVVVPLAILWGEGWLRSGRRWIQEGRPPTEAETTAVLRAPLRLFFVHATVWMAAALTFTILNLVIEFELVARVGFTVALAGLVTSAFAYLLAERITRPLAKAALSIRSVRKPRLPGITTRTIAGWTLGSGIPLVGLITVGIFALADPASATKTKLAVTMLVLGGTALVVGAGVELLGARAIAEPITSLRRAIRRLAEGDLDTRVEVSDGSVLGLLQSGFNDMARGVQEREQLQDLYQRQVGEDVALGALERGSELGGELREVAVLFVDVVGSTELAAARPAEEVVELLNRFFGVVIDEVHEHGGWVNKFQGDATLVVFGAPAELDDSAGRALAAARALGRRLPAEVPELAAGIGAAFGPAVAGNIGDERRFEFTVIGDPVNEAARLTELAKQRRPMVLASVEAVAAASPTEQACWAECGAADLRGRSRPTRLAAPVDP
ncbi:MAG TPA: adenylate/guanylate cyclase domain-containing protein [Acidimicrobiales bacterium]|nr:adenylate/guanylate cyclase domain-containing protein [Acidimicrobiales bacterium]